MNKTFEGKSIFLVGGPGGVGKTTCAAALGIHFACSGFKTVVLTVDPAKRLAQALGFDNFHKELQKVEIPNFPQSELFATMLDSQNYFDKVIDRFARNKEQKERILSSPLYKTMVDSLGGTHEYAAMERLLEFSSSNQFEKIVVDTPPTQNAIDLLSAPQRLADFMDNSVIKWFQGPKPVYLQFFKQGTRLAMKMIRVLFGTEFMDSFTRLMDDFEGMQAGFRERNLEVLELLRDKRTAFLLTTYPSETRYLESVSFRETLKQFQISLSGIVLNRIEPFCPPTIDETTHLTEKTKGEVEAILKYLNLLYEQQRYWVDKYSESFSSVPTALIPRQDTGLQDIASLSHLGSFLVS
jgi:anion-transporting  ArsA/GET3 family ATPase